MAPAATASGSGRVASSTSSKVASKGKAPASSDGPTAPGSLLDEPDPEEDTRPSFAEEMGLGKTGKGKQLAVDDEDAVMLDPELVAEGEAGQEDGPSLMKFDALKDHGAKVLTQSAKVAIPPHRMTPLKRSWPLIYAPLVEELGLRVRVNPQARRVELKTSKSTTSTGILPKATAFLQAFALGFTAEDSLALLRMEDIYIESFEVKDVKTLHGDHLSRAIGRIAGKDGRTRFTIENASRTRIVLADSKIHILGTFQAIKIARDAVCALILGSPPGKVYHGLRTVAARQRERF